MADCSVTAASVVVLDCRSMLSVDSTRICGLQTTQIQQNHKSLDIGLQKDSCFNYCRMITVATFNTPSTAAVHNIESNSVIEILLPLSV